MAFIPIYHQLLPLQLLDRLSELASETKDKPFYVTSSALYHLVRRTVLGEAHVSSLDTFYPRNLVVWNRYYAKWVISHIYAILKIVYADIVCYDLNTVEFDPKRFEREIKSVEEFIRTIYRKHIPLQFATYIDLSHIECQCACIGSVLPLCRRILDRVAVRVLFEKSPSIDDMESTLWNKLHCTNATSAILMEGSIDPVCPVCRREQIVMNGNFAIVDCGDVLCVKCARTTLDVPNFQESRCPVCYERVFAWTDHKHFLLFKSSWNLKTLLWKHLASLEESNAEHVTVAWHRITSKGG